MTENSNSTPNFKQEQLAKDLTKKSIGEIIREHRTKKGLTQDALAAALYVTPQAVSRWETGQTTPDINLLLPLSKLLGLGVDQLLGGDRRQYFEDRYGQVSCYGPAAQLLVCEEALKEFPNDVGFLYRRASCEFYLGKHSQTDENLRRSYLNHAAEHAWSLHYEDPDDKGYISLLTQIYVELGDRKEAEALLSRCKDMVMANRMLADYVLEGEEKIKLQQALLEQEVIGLYNRLLNYNTPESIAVAHSLLDITLGKEKHLHFGLLYHLYLAQAKFSLEANDMVGYEKHMIKAYEAAEAHDRDISDAGCFTAPLFDHIGIYYDPDDYPLAKALAVEVLTDRKLTPPCEAKRHMVEQHIRCSPLLSVDAPAYYSFCIDHICQGSISNFSHTWDMSEQEIKQFDDRIPGNTRAYVMELHRQEVERLIKDGIMSGYVALPQGCGRGLIFGYCNCGAKEKYKGMPDEWKALTEPEGNRVFAIMELLSAPTFRDCGLEEKLVNHAMTEAKAQGFTHVQTCLWERLYLDKEGNDTFEHLLALYSSLGFTVHADWSDHRRVYLMQKEL